MNPLITITGPSCSGKTTLQNFLFDHHNMQRIVSFTTRPKRETETDGIDYYFMSKPVVEDLLHKSEIAELVDFSGNYYGILGSELQQKLTQGVTVAVVEPNGVNQLHAYCQENNLKHFAIYLTNPPMVTTARFLQRLQKNPDASPIDYAKRIINMLKDEQEWIYKYNYSIIIPSYDRSNEAEIHFALGMALRTI